MGSIATTEFRKRRKENLVKVCGSKCNLCGYNKTIGALEFHHINSEEKLYGISSNGTCHNLESDLNEVQKCILVCANCHREIHEGLYTKEDLIKSKLFLEEVANELREKKEKKRFFCEKCGKEITKYSKHCLCETCAHINSRVCERPNREELKQMIRTIPFTEIARKFAVSDKAIVKWCISYDLPHRKTDIREYSDAQW